MSTSITPYLFFSGRCEEALDFYREALGARIEVVMRYNESPDPIPPGMLQPGFESKIMHASFRIGEASLMASDGCDDKGNFAGFQLAMCVETEADAQRVFHALASTGSVSVPLGPTFWSPCFGMLTDKFNITWMVMVPGPAAK
jgi:PhnB protein